MKLFKYIIAAALPFFPAKTDAAETEAAMNRIRSADQKYEQLFASKRRSDPSDPELMNILQNFIFGEIFYIGDINDQTRELITVAALTAIQALPQLKAHINAALNVGDTPVEIRETIYQCAPFIGFPRTLNAIAVFNEVLREKGIKLPLENQATVTEENRFSAGEQIQQPLYGSEVKTAMRRLPEEYATAVPDILTNFCFGDFYTRKGLNLRQRELLSLVVLTATGAEKQLKAHIIGNIKAGNDKSTLLAAMVQLVPYIGLPGAMTAINLIKNAEIDTYQPIYGEQS